MCTLHKRSSIIFNCFWVLEVKVYVRPLFISNNVCVWEGVEWSFVPTIGLPFVEALIIETHKND
jgi:hypothetical protein